MGNEKMPERIWLRSGWDDGNWYSEKIVDNAIEYIRADLHDAEIARLREAAESALAWINRTGEHAPIAFGGEAEIATKLHEAVRNEQHLSALNQGVLEHEIESRGDRYVKNLNDKHAQLLAANAKIARLTDFIRDLKLIREHVDYDLDEFCIVCERTMEKGHDKDCPVPKIADLLEGN